MVGLAGACARGLRWRRQVRASGTVERKLYAFTSDAWYPGKPETDLSLASEPVCIGGVPKGSPDGKRVLLVRAGVDTGRLFPAPDWNPVATPTLSGP